MKLAQIIENPLSQIAEFEVSLWLNSDIPENEQLKDLTAQFTTDPPPGVTPIDGMITSYGQPDAEGMITARLRTSVEEYIRNSVEYGNDPYHILTMVRNATDPQTAALAHQFMQNNPDLKIAMIGKDEEGLQGDSWPAKIDF